MNRATDLPAVEYAARSDPGRDPEKQINEDAYGHRPTRFGHLCVVCDGMGGHAAGREAAELALATIFETFDLAPDETPPAQLLRSALEEASRRVHGMRTSEVAPGRPGSTVVALLLHAQGTEVAHVGDSRAYLVHEGQIFRLTRDHSLVQELVDRGLLTPQQAVHHPEANRITRALGMAAEVEPELRPQPVHHVTGDALVLCTDGLCDLVEDHEILGVVGGEPAAQAVGKLVDLANARGGHDNITVVVLRVRETAEGATTTVANTVAQTSAAEATLAHSPLTLVEQPLASRPLELTPAPRTSTTSLRPRRHGGPAVLIGLGLAVVAAVLLVGVLLEEFAERRGKRNSATGSLLDLRASDAASDAPNALNAPTTLAPERIVIPAASVPSEPIAPLDPSPITPTKRKP
ncbi:MAG: protein phosphatase 2C domain-containing protein [Myxococcota bacterium]|nr:protein phosphatase 2C domain-containing protein [Myxococcota bacterium]